MYVFTISSLPKYFPKMHPKRYPTKDLNGTFQAIKNQSSAYFLWHPHFVRVGDQNRFKMRSKIRHKIVPKILRSKMMSKMNSPNYRKWGPKVGVPISWNLCDFEISFWILLEPFWNVFGHPALVRNRLPHEGLGSQFLYFWWKKHDFEANKLFFDFFSPLAGLLSFLEES